MNGVFNIEQAFLFNHTGPSVLRNSIVWSRENVDRVQEEVRAAIGRGLREHYDVGARPMPDRLADLVSNIDHPNGLHVKKPLLHIKELMARWRSKPFWPGG
jgi:hypothetical protein